MKAENMVSRTWPTWLAVLGACLIFWGLVTVTKRYTQPPPLGAERAAERAKALAELRAANTEALNNVGWVDATKGIVRLPIAEAMKLTEQAWQNPAAARADLLARAAKAVELPPEKPSEFE